VRPTQPYNAAEPAANRRVRLARRADKSLCGMAPGRNMSSTFRRGSLVQPWQRA